MSTTVTITMTVTETAAATGVGLESELSDDSTNITLTGGYEKLPAPIIVTACTC